MPNAHHPFYSLYSHGFARVAVGVHVVRVGRVVVHYGRNLQRLSTERRGEQSVERRVAGPFERDRADDAARQAGIPALAAEVASARNVLDTPAARLLSQGEERVLWLKDVEALQASKALVVDAFRHLVRQGAATVSLASRPVLFALARTLAEAWPADASRETLLKQAFGARQADDSHRARLRVEIGRLRAKLRPLAAIAATAEGFAMRPRRAREIVVLARPVEEPHGEVLAFLADGESWSSSALALALGASQRTVQRALDTLAAAGKVQSFGRGRARRWIAPPVPGFTTTLLLPAPLPGD